MKGQGKPKGWITRNGVHIPIFLQPLIHPEVEVVHSVEMILGIIGFVTY
jgi:hypothetical protein